MRGPRRWHLPAILRLQSTNRENKWAFKLQRHEVYREGRLPRRLCGAQGPPARHASCALSCLWVVPVCAHTCFSPCGLVILPQGCPPCVLSRPVHCPAVSVAPPPPRRVPCVRRPYLCVVPRLLCVALSVVPLRTHVFSCATAARSEKVTVRSTCVHKHTTCTKEFAMECLRPYTTRPRQEKKNAHHNGVLRHNDSRKGTPMRARQKERCLSWRCVCVCVVEVRFSGNPDKGRHC